MSGHIRVGRSYNIIMWMLAGEIVETIRTANIVERDLYGRTQQKQT